MKRTDPAIFEIVMSALADGSNLQSACALAGISKPTLSARRQADPVFDSNVRAVTERRRNAGAWDRLLAQIERTGSVRKSLKLQGAPPSSSFYRKLGADNQFACRVADARARGLAALAAIPKKDRVRPAAARSVGLSPTNKIKPQTLALVIAGLTSGLSMNAVLAGPGMPDKKTIAAVRKRGAAFDVLVRQVYDPTAVRRGQIYPPAAYDRVLDLIKSGTRVRDLGGAGVPTPKTVRAFAKRSSDFRLRLSGVIAARRFAYDGDFLHRAHLSQNSMWRAANEAVSSLLPTFVRDDIISEMVADLIEGCLAFQDIRQAAREYVSEFYRQSGERRHLSMDAGLGRDGTFSLHDRIAS